ncbi:Bud site selection protein 6 [Tulasnella sp. 427]|nr:Bud site selection protein 6 [Tulasnella sp. 427]
MATDIARQAHRVNGSSSTTHGRTNSTRSSGSGGGSSSETPAPTRSSGSRSRNGPSGGVESAVTRLLVAIKQLLESLTSWSAKKISEQDVSDVYVRLGNDFNACVVAFASFDIDMRQVDVSMELRGVPEELRHVLETCLAEEATPETLERFLPQVREIITDLLQGLRHKQSQFRAMSQERAQKRTERQNSTGTAASGRRSSGRSTSKARPLPAPQIPEEETIQSPLPPLPSEPIPPQVQSPLPPVVASAVPGRMSLGRRKHSGSAQRAGSPLSLMSDGDSARAGPSIATSPRKASVTVTASVAPSAAADPDGLAELAANASAAEETLRSPAPPKVSLASTSRPTSEKSPVVEDLSTDSIDSSTTVTPGVDDTPPKPPKPLPPVSPDVKRYSLIDKPIGSPPGSSEAYPFPNLTPSSSSNPTFSLVSATPSPPLASGSTLGSAPESPLDPALVSQEPAVESSIVALQKSDVLERKASKRFSSYTFTKMAGGAAGLGSLKQLGSSKNLNRRSIAPSASIGQLTTQDLEALAEVDETRDTSQIKRNSVANLVDGLERKGKSPTPGQAPPVPSLPEGAKASPISSRGTSPIPVRRQGTADSKPPADKPVVNGVLSRPGTRPSSPTPQLSTVFLQVGRHVKKVTIDPDTPLSFASLRVLFVDKFAYNPGQDNFPAIYIRDANSGVQYEMEDIEEVKDGCLLSLNIERKALFFPSADARANKRPSFKALDQVKQHIDLQMTALTSEIKDLRSAINAQKRQSLVPPQLVVGDSNPTTPQPARPTDQQFNLLARRLSRLRTDDAKGLPINFNTPKPLIQPLVEQTTGSTYQPLAPQTTGGSSWTFNSDGGSTARIVGDLKTQFDEIQNLRRDLGVMRQLYVDFINQTKESLGALRTQTANVKDLANAKVGGARAYIDSGKASLDTRSQTVLTKVEELQDTVESLKDDVLKRHVSPKSSIMKSLTANLATTKAELESLKEHIATVKPMWKKTWEEELQNIVDEQGFLTHQEEFIEDLIEDYKALTEVFGHVEKIVKVRNTTMTTSGSGTGGRVMRTGRQFRPPPPEPGSNGLSTVMLEIRGAQVDPAKRLKAIEANQKARHKELMSRSNEFQEELGDFVSGKKLKKTGGIEETERLRQARNDYTLKNMFSPQTGGVSGGGMINAGMPGNTGSPTKPSAGGGTAGAGLGMAGVTFASAPPLDDSDDDEDEPAPPPPAAPPARKSGGFFSGLPGLTFSKAPDLPDSP